MKALTVTKLHKVYKSKVTALKNVAFDIDDGDFFALLGPNGAGKTTIIGIITGLVNKTAGTIKVFGKDLDTEHEEAKRYIGIVPQEFNFNIFENVIDIIINQAGFYGIPRHIAIPRATTLLKALGLWNKRKQHARNLSGGMKRKLMIARGLVHKPKLLILDEPTAGVDVETRRDMWHYFTKLNKKGVTIILTTHYLEEAERLCKKIAIIDKGKIIENTTMKHLVSKLHKESFILDLKEPISDLKGLEKFKLRKLDNCTLELELSRSENLNEVFAHLDKKNIKVLSLRNESSRLEEFFLNIVKK